MGMLGLPTSARYCGFLTRYHILRSCLLAIRYHKHDGMYFVHGISHLKGCIAEEEFCFDSLTHTLMASVGNSGFDSVSSPPFHSNKNFGSDR